MICSEYTYKHVYMYTYNTNRNKYKETNGNHWVSLTHAHAVEFIHLQIYQATAGYLVC